MQFTAVNSSSSSPSMCSCIACTEIRNNVLVWRLWQRDALIVYRILRDNRQLAARKTECKRLPRDGYIVLSGVCVCVRARPFGWQGNDLAFGSECNVQCAAIENIYKMHVRHTLCCVFVRRNTGPNSEVFSHPTIRPTPYGLLPILRYIQLVVWLQPNDLWHPV